MKSVTYLGPQDENDQSSYIVVKGETLHIGGARDVEDDVATACEAVDGHDFEFGKAESDEKTPAQKYADAHSLDDLQTEATTLGLDASGTKLEIAERIVAHNDTAGQ